MRVDSYASSTDGQTNNLYQNSNIMMENRQQRADDSDNHHHHAYAKSNVETSSLLSSSLQINFTPDNAIGTTRNLPTTPLPSIAIADYNSVHNALRESHDNGMVNSEEIFDADMGRGEKKAVKYRFASYSHSLRISCNSEWYFAFHKLYH